MSCYHNTNLSLQRSYHHNNLSYRGHVNTILLFPTEVMTTNCAQLCYIISLWSLTLTLSNTWHQKRSRTQVHSWSPCTIGIDSRIFLSTYTSWIVHRIMLCSGIVKKCTHVISVHYTKKWYTNVLDREHSHCLFTILVKSLIRWPDKNSKIYLPFHFMFEPTNLNCCLGRMQIMLGMLWLRYPLDCQLPALEIPRNSRQSISQRN